MDNEKVISKHLTAFRENLNDIRKDGKFSDFLVCVEEQEFAVHRLILAASSDYFKAMFSYNSVESNDNKVHLKDVSSEAVKAIIDFCYNCKIDLTVDNVQEILIAASILQVDAVQSLCVNFMKDQVNSTNCLGVASIADRYNLFDLFQVALNYCLNRFQTVMFNKEFLELDEAILSRLLSHDELNVDDEVQVFQAIVSWILADEKNRLSKLDMLMENVRFAYIEPIRLVSLSSNELIKNSIKCRDLIDRAKNYLLLKEYPQELPIDPVTYVKPRNCLRRQQRLFAVGGWTDEYKSIASAEMYDPNIDRWIELEPMAEKRCGVGLTTLGESIYAVGGHDGRDYLGSIERYDVNSRIWYKDVTNMKYIRTSVGVTTLDGHIYAVGGQISSGSTDRVEKYDPKSNTWTECRPMIKKRLGAGIAVLHGYIYVMGGSESNTVVYDSVEKYNPLTDKWSYVASMTTPRKHLGCTTCKGKIYAVGGRNKSGELDSAECYDPINKVWTRIQPMHMKRCGIGVVELGGLVYVLGGQNDDARLNVVEAYNPNTEKWIWKKSMNHGRLGGGMTVYPIKTI